MKEIDFLNHILKIFLQNAKNNFIILKVMKEEKLLEDSFEDRYILNNVNYEFQLMNVFYENTENVDYFLEATDCSLYKLNLIFLDKWYLKSFLFQCQGCFCENSGCDICDGSGWGVL
jgi:hypothetical protein